MATIAQIRADLVGSSASFRAAMVDGQRQANTSLAEIRRDVASTSASISALSKTAAGFIGFEAVKAGVSNLLDAQKAIQQIHYSLLSATGSGTAANEAYDAVSKTAQRLGLDLQTSALGFSSMSAAANANGVSMKDQMALFEGLARSSTVLHLSSEQSGRAITALSQIFGKGKIQSEELRQQLGDAIPGVVPRFQTAVMAMIKGTDLAGKSFDQLLQSGDLTVQRFLPALVQALNETGRGAEQAVNGPVAALNRLSSSWFKLKADLSGGLFADAAVASINLVTNNLEHLADVAGITGGLIVARLAGGGLSQAAGVGTDYVAQQRAAREAAAAASELAQQNTAAAAAEVRQNEAALAGVATARQQALAQRDAATALYEKALAENEAAQATLAHQRTAATLSANIRAQRDAVAQAAAAQVNLTRAEAQYNATQAGHLALTEQKIALEGALFRARGAATIATEAEIVAERQLAATSAAGLLARGAAGVGNLALSLVGGPWGAVVAAIGAVSYAIYDTQKRSENYRHETDELVKSLQQVRTEAEATAKTFGTLDSSMSIKQGLEQYQQESQAIAGQRQQLADLESQAQKLRETMSARSGTQGGAGNAIADALDERKLEQVTQRIDALRGQLGPASTAVDALGTKMAGALAPSIDSVKHAIDQLAKGKPLLDVIFDLSAGADKGIAAADTALANVRTAINGIAASTKQMTDKAATEGLNNAQKAAYDHSQRLADLAKLSPVLQPGLRAKEETDYSANLQAAQRLDAAGAAKKAATEAASQARQWKQQADSLNQSLLQTHNELTAQLDSTQRLTPAEKQLQDIIGGTNDAYNHAAAALQKKMLAQAQANAELSKSIVLQQQEAAATARSTALQEQLASRIQRQRESNDIATTSVGHGQQLTQQLQDELRIRQEYDRQRQQYDKEAGRLQAGTAGSVGSTQYNDDVARMFASQQQELALYRAGVQSRLEAEQDWVIGARAAFEDYASSARDQAGQAQQALSNGFRTLEDDVVNFAMTGKASFKDFANSIISDFIRIQVRAQASGILGTLASAFVPALSGSENAAALSSSISKDISGYRADVGQYSVSDFLGSLSKGGRESGGSVDAGSLYEVAEGGKPELLTAGGRVYLMTGAGGGSVTPASRATSGSVSTSSGGSTPQVIVNLKGYQGEDPTVKQSQDSSGNLNIEMEFKRMIDSRMSENLANTNSPQSRILRSIHGTRPRGTPVGS